MVIELAEYIIDDWSLGGLETCIGVRSKNTDVATPVNPEDKGSWKKLNVVFDVGIARNCVMYCDALFITHGHADHSASLTNALGKRLVTSKNDPSMDPTLKVFAPMFLAPDLEDTVTRTLRNGCSQHFMSSLQMTSVKLGSSYYLTGSAKQRFGQDNIWTVMPFRSTHSIPCYGYLLYLEGRPEVAYTGDTTISLFYLPENQDLLYVNLLIIEVSGWDLDNDADVETTHKSGHIHIRDIVENKEIFESIKNIVAFHVQPKYSAEFIQSIVERLPEGVKEKFYVCMSALNNFYGN
ncbi:uncharacterized protein LOC142351864 [Convolutriloba macropyga]|uniref:uncharacterized protein LOC142351864 n=1 Tax=Convolutriloba macropyga TaxID=536237 RepID=UPI003F51B319